ncbi:D-alanine--D-alanine ligase [Rubripirellula tenax]|uniref:D-alanine--D-alanine ligase n=1 Tax=Rubripirellula tenax TaxID=2528015 RepID=A0A5C6FEC5_9BACT|nr:ATP-grasp domain-containing protein [Rubripirellula tenax]TWU58950.1 D-alanine--D-alanine ligase [Rubripirellula tenax]
MAHNPANELVVAILHQAVPPPRIGNTLKPMKPGGYRDSGADIAFALRSMGIKIVTECRVRPDDDSGWSFPDSEIGIDNAIARGANCLWLNTVLYEGHSIEQWLHRVRIVGQHPSMVHRCDDKYETNQLLRHSGCPVVDSRLVDLRKDETPIEFPVVIKPVRGRGSQGVRVILDAQQWRAAVDDFLTQGSFGTIAILEPFLAGEECTVTIMPPGRFSLHEKACDFESPWCLPPVQRFNHEFGVAPYNGTVAVTKNSRVFDNRECRAATTKELMQACVLAYGIVDARAPIRIDCRKDHEGRWLMFDLNAKPNMTGAGRPGRENQDGLVAMASISTGLSYRNLVSDLVVNSWTVEEIDSP